MMGPLLTGLFAAGVLLCAWVWTRRDAVPLRWSTRLVVGVLLAAMLVPGEAVAAATSWLRAYFGDPEPVLSHAEAAAWIHVLLFAVVAFLLARLRRPIGWAPLAAFLGLLAASTEALQHFSPGRDPSLLDVGLNLAGACTGVALLLMLSRLGLPVWAPLAVDLRREDR